jgi:NTE family protein
MEKTTVSLVLGSGSARGLAHIGVIDCIEQHDMVIKSVAGSSMGALVGGIYATGKLDAYRHWVCALNRADVFRLLDFSFGLSGLFKGERVIDLLRQLIGDCNIEDLPIPFTAVATDIDTGKEVWFRRGPLFDAIRASIAIPAVFTPYHYGGRRLVDGGLSNPVPIAPTLSDMNDLTIAVNLTGRAEVLETPATESEDNEGTFAQYRRAIGSFVNDLYPDANDAEPQSLGLFDVVANALDTLQATVAQFKLAATPPDVLIDIPRNAAGTMEFFRARELIALGYSKASAVLGVPGGSPSRDGTVRV